MLDYIEEKERIILFIREYFRAAGKKRAVIGLSGGLDSAVIAALTTEALRAENICCLILPYQTSSPANVEDALQLVKALSVEHRVISITPYVETYYRNNSPEASILRRGNFMARIRMCILFDISAELDALVVGTGNKSELLTGYTTQYGDNACAFEPIGHLYKTEVFQLASTLNLPATIIEKQPSADLWEGQTDEEEMSISYQTLDDILRLLVDRRLSSEEIALRGFDQADIEKAKQLYHKSEFKRKLPPTIEEIDS